MSSLGGFFFASSSSRRSRNYYGLGFAGNKKIAREHGDVAGLAKQYVRSRARVCVWTCVAVTGGAMRRKSLARLQSGFYAPLSPAKNDYTEGEISASFASELILNYRLSGSGEPSE